MDHSSRASRNSTRKTSDLGETGARVRASNTGPPGARDERICPVCLQPIQASDVVKGSGDDLMHQACDYTAPAKLPRPRRLGD
jgi:hypothetical protein